MSFQTRRNSRARFVGLLMGGASSAILATMPGAYAQRAVAADDSLETVIVTGTLLKGINPVGTNVITFDSSDIKASGSLTPDQILSNIPQLTNLFGAVAVNFQQGGKSTAPAPAIRNLDTAGHSTLVLINGTDVVGDGGLQNTTDAAQVPAIALQRVDVVADGGSSLYGAQAVAGIVNFITRKNFEGLEGTQTYGTTGNYETMQTSIIGGHAWSSGSAFLAYEFRKNSEQMARDRPIPRQNLIPLGGTLDNSSTTCDRANITVGSTKYTLNSNTVSTAPGSVKAAASLGTLKCDTNLNSSIFGQDDQNTVWGQFNQTIADGIEFSASMWWAHSNLFGLNSAAGTSNGTITNANPYFQAIGTETKQTISFNYSSVMGPTYAVVTRTEQLGFTPQLDIKLGGSWDLNLTGTYQRAANARNQPQGSGDTVAANAALISPDINFALDPYNLGVTNAAVQHIVNYTQIFASHQHLESLKATVTGTVLTLPGGDLRVAAGGQYEFTDYLGLDITGPQGQNQGPPVFGGLFITSKARRVVQALFGEFVVPLVGKDNEMFGIHSLILDVSGRYDHYSDFGATSNPKIGVTYEPIAGLSFRANMGTSFASPNLGDTDAAVDTRVTVSSSSGIRAPLSVSGVSAAQDAIDANRPTIGIAGGSPGLQPQKANTNSYGFDWAPDFIPGLDMGLTKWHVSFYNIIAIIPYTTNNLLYGVPAYAPYYIINPTLAQVTAFTTLPNGTPIAQQGFAGYAQYYTGPANTQPYQIRDLRRHNLGNQFNEGLDFHISYTTETGIGVVTAGLDGSDSTLFKVQGFTGGVITDQLPANVAPYQFSAKVGLANGPFNGRVTMNYISGYTVTGVVAQTHVSPFVVTNLSLAYDLDGTRDMFSGASINLNINNLFDVLPPFINTGSGYPTAPTSEFTIGRLFQFGFTKKF